MASESAVSDSTRQGFPETVCVCVCVWGGGGGGGG